MMNGEAQKLGAKRLLNVLGIRRIELVLFWHPAVSPFGGRIFAADFVQLAKHDIAEMGRGCDVKANGRKDPRFSIVVTVDRGLFWPRKRYRFAATAPAGRDHA